MIKKCKYKFNDNGNILKDKKLRKIKMMADKTAMHERRSLLHL